MPRNLSKTRQSGVRYTIQGLMLVVLLIGAGLGVLLNLPRNANPDAWRDRLVSAHVVTLGFVIPLATILLYTLWAAPVLDPRAKKERTGLTMVTGCLFSTMVIGSLLFWLIVMAMVRD